MSSPHRRPWLGVAALTLSAWLAFGLLQVVLAQSVAAVRDDWWLVARFYLALALMWAALSPAIAGWNRLVRRSISGALPRFVAHVPAVLLAALANAVVRRAMVRAAGMTNTVPFAATLLYYADLVAVSYVAVVLVADALDKSRALGERRRVARALEGQLARARMEYLDAQLQPHFLFNSLGAVSELAHEAPRTAARVLRQLASLLRSAFATETDRVTLGQELVALEPYLEIQRIRFTDWLDIVHDIDDRAADCVVPRLILQPLVENAVRHGVSGRDEPGCIRIEARIEDARLIVRVHDNGVGLQPRAAGAGRGIGLANLRERLIALYGDNARLRLHREETGTVAELSLPAIRGDTALAALVEPAPAASALVSPTPPREYSVAAVVGVWAICGLLWTQQSIAYMALRHRLAGASLLSIARSDLTTALLWAAFTIAIFAAAARFPITAARTRVRVAAYALGGVFVSAAHILLSRALGESELPLMSQPYAGMFAMNTLIFWGMVAIGHRRQLARWMYERETETERLAAELVDARSAATRLRADPALLLSMLERLAALVVVDAARTERALTRLGDYLRLSLDAGATSDPAPRGAALDALTRELGAAPEPVRGAGAA
jgi:sensor histidine kinase YesM